MTDTASVKTAPSAKWRLKNYIVAFAGASWLTTQVVDFGGTPPTVPNEVLPASDTTAKQDTPVAPLSLTGFSGIQPNLTYSSATLSEEPDLADERIATIMLKANDIPADTDQRNNMIKDLIEQSGNIGLSPLYKAITALHHEEILWQFLRVVGDDEYRSRMPETAPLLKAALNSSDAGARSAAASSLAALGTPEALAALRSHLDHETNKFVCSLIRAYVT